MSTLAASTRIMAPVVAAAAQVNFPANFPALLVEGAYAGIYALQTRAGVVTTLDADDFTIIDATDDSFTLALDTPATAGDIIQVYGQILEQRTQALTPGGAILTETYETDADSFEAQLQEHRRDIGRALLTPLQDATPPATLPPAATRAGQLLGFDNTGAPTLYPRNGALIAAAGYPLAAGGGYGARTDTGVWSGLLPASAGVQGAHIRVADAGFNAAVNNFTVEAAGGDVIKFQGAASAVYLLNTSNTGVELWAVPGGWVAIAYGA